MSCTPEEIEKKRKLALEKLQFKKLKLASPVLRNSNPVDSKLMQSNVCVQQTDGNQFKLTKSTSATLESQHSSRHSVNIYNSVKPTKNVSYGGNSRRSNICSTVNELSARLVPSKGSLNSSSVRNEEINVQRFFGDSITGTSYLISESRFEINVKYHEQLISIFRSTPSASYNVQNKLWSFSIQDYSSLILKLSKLQPHVTIQKIPNYALSLLDCSKTSPKNQDINLEKIEAELLNVLMPFQIEGVLFAIRNNGKCLIADEMGLGKTLQSLAVASYYRDDWPLLIVTTSSMKNTWEEAVRDYLPSVPLAFIRYMSSGKDYIKDSQVLIISYDMMTRCTDILLQMKFGFIIVDESHIIKNFKAKCTKSAIALCKTMRRVILLTGTPALSRPSELYSQLSLIDDRFFGNFFEFSKRYCDGQQTQFGWDASGKSNLTELEVILKKKFMIRRTKDDVLSSLPTKSREIIRLDVGLNKLSKEDKMCLDTLNDHYTKSKKGNEKHTLLLQLFSESARLKIPSVCLYVENLLKANEKFLVFAHHKVMMDAICKLLDKNKKEFIRIDGNVNSDQRKYAIKKFQLRESCIAAVLSITAANAGITLTAANLVVFAELHWNPSILCQAESRVHRIGQENEVKVRYLLAPGTVDDHMWPLLESKQNVLNEVGLSKDSFKDTSVSDQIVCSPSELTRAGTKSISDYFYNLKESNGRKEGDEMLKEFLSNDDDDIFANVDFDF